MKRWIIRSFFIALLLLCVAGWERSWEHSNSFSVSPGGVWLICRTLPGAVKVVLWSRTDRFHHAWRLDFGADDDVSPPDMFWPTLGFDLYHGSFPDGGSTFQIQVPFWFLTVLFGLFLFIVWRKTRSRKPGRLFPVEMVKQVEGKTDKVV